MEKKEGTSNEYATLLEDMRIYKNETLSAVIDVKDSMLAAVQNVKEEMILALNTAKEDTIAVRL